MFDHYPTHCIHLTLSETEEHIYVRVGDTVTLRPPPRASTRKQYVTWSFGGKDIAGYNTFKSWVDTGKRCIFYIYSHEAVFSPSINARAVNYFQRSDLKHKMLAFYICLADKKWENASMPGDVWLQIKSVSLGHFGTFVCRLTYGGDQAIIDSVSYTLVKVDGRNTNKNVILTLDNFYFSCRSALYNLETLCYVL